VPFPAKNSFDLALKCVVKTEVKAYYYQVIKYFNICFFITFSFSPSSPPEATKRKDLSFFRYLEWKICFGRLKSFEKTFFGLLQKRRNKIKV